MSDVYARYALGFGAGLCIAFAAAAIFDVGVLVGMVLGGFLPLGMGFGTAMFYLRRPVR